MNNLEVIYKKVDDLIPYENNPRKNDKAVEAVANSIKEFGFKVPIIIDSENVIVAGDTRLKAAQHLGLESVPCVLADDLDDEQVRAFRIADNKVGGLADWDMARLEEELNLLDDAFDMTDFGFGEVELSMLTGEFEPTPYDDEETAEYSSHEEDYLVKERVIITYTKENKIELVRLLGLEKLDKVLYDITELV